MKKHTTRILIVVPKYQPDIEKRGLPYVLPLGIMYVSSYMKQNGFHVDCLNLNHYDDSKLQKVLGNHQYDVICTGGVYTEITPIGVVINTARQVQPKAKTVLGGALASGDPEFVLEKLMPDFLVLGEGEVTMVELLCAIENKSNFKEVKGIVFCENGVFIKTPPRKVLIADLDNHPYPDYEGFEFNHFLAHHSLNQEHLSTVMDIKNRRTGCITSSRNCVCKCTFCFRLMTGGFRTRSIDALMTEIDFLIEKYGINEIDLVDEMFASKKQRVYEFCEKIKPFGIHWQCQLRVTFIDKDLLIAMKDAGCYLISYGFESGSEKVLKSMKKGISPAQIENAIRLTSQVGICIQANFIFGDPAETLETMNETIRFRRKFSTIYFGWGMVVPYPGTVLYNDLKKKGKLPNLYEFHENSRGYTLLGLPVNMTNLSMGDFEFLCRKIALEITMSFVPGKVLNSQKLDSQNVIATIRCSNCAEVNREVKLNVNKRQVLCKKCFQRLYVKRSDLVFDPYEKIYHFYQRFILSFFLANVTRYRFASPMITRIKRHGKIGRLAMRLLGGKV